MSSGRWIARIGAKRRGATVRVGWVADGTLQGAIRSFRKVPPPVSMRISNNALWINANSDAARNEIYDRGRAYDVVVFFKAMDARCQQEALRVREEGGKVVFDANVNYYEVWGEYDVPATRPTATQQRDAHAMTRLADHVVADSSYLLDVVRPLNANATWIPDNVDMSVFKGIRRHERRRVTRLVWSGVAKKARPLLSIADALAALRDVELVVVSDGTPDVLDELREAIPCRLVRFGERRYARTLLDCDVIISPKRLVNAYEVGHTEYKITLGMAVGLPAVASPQRSYVEVLADGGGLVADSVDEWRAALERLVAEPELRAELGARARATVLERYATPVTARRYLELMCSLA